MSTPDTVDHSAHERQDRQDKQDRQDQQHGLQWQPTQELRSLSAAVELFTQAVAEHMGINTTDLQCLNLIHEIGAPTAGELAAKTGLSSGSITGVVDRLERAGYVQRQADQADRRKVHLVPTAKAGQVAQTVFLPMLAEVAQNYATYTEAELRLIVEFMRRTRLTLAEQAERIRRQGRIK